VLAIVIFIARRFLPESPRWFAEQGRFDRADAELARVEAEVQRHLDEPLPPPSQIRPVPGVQGNPIALLWTKRYLKWTIMAAGLWFFALLGYFGLTTWLTTLLHREGFSIAKSLGFTTLISLGGFPGFIAASYLIEWIGRKPTMAVFLLGSAGMAYFYGHPAPGWLFVEGFAMQFFFFGMWCVLYAYTPELYPTNARASGAGWASAFGRIGAIIGPIVVGAVLTSVGTGGVFTIGAASFVVAVLLVLVLGPETRGRVLEDITERTTQLPVPTS